MSMIRDLNQKNNIRQAGNIKLLKYFHTNCILFTCELIKCFDNHVVFGNSCGIHDTLYLLHDYYVMGSNGKIIGENDV